MILVYFVCVVSQIKIFVSPIMHVFSYMYIVCTYYVCIYSSWVCVYKTYIFINHLFTKLLILVNLIRKCVSKALKFKLSIFHKKTKKSS